VPQPTNIIDGSDGLENMLHGERRQTGRPQRAFGEIAVPFFVACMPFSYHARHIGNELLDPARASEDHPENIAQQHLLDVISSRSSVSP
jgi:hypothetical protein